MAGLIPKPFIQDVIDRTNIVDIIDGFVPLKKMGANFKACCPFHGEKTPSFTVSPTKQIYHCFGCQASGNVVSFLMAYDQLSFVESIEKLANMLGLEVPREGGTTQQQPKMDNHYALMENISAYYQQQLANNDTAKHYLKERGFDQKTLETFRVGFAPPGWRNLNQALRHKDSNLLLETGMQVQKAESAPYDRFRERIMFPIINRRGHVIGFGGRVIKPDDMPKYLNSPETKLFHKNFEVYGLYTALKTNRNPQEIFVVEGYLDVLALHQYGISQTVATLGTATSEHHIRMLSRYSRKIICCFDGDKAGRQAAVRALQQGLPLLNEGLSLHFMFLPNGQDPDSYVRTQGSAAFLNLAKSAADAGEFLIAHCQETLDLSNIADRSRLVEKCKPLINKIPAVTYRQFVLERLAQVVRMDIDKLERLTNIQTTSQRAPIPRHSPLGKEQLALALLIQNPNLATEFANLKKPSMLDGDNNRLLATVCLQIEKHPNLSTAGLLELHREAPHFSQFQALATRELHVPEDGVKEEWLGLIQAIGQQASQSQIERLLSKANREGLDNDERKLLQQMIKQRKTQKD